MNHYYVHIPFCHRVCPYCKFAVSPMINEVTKKRYLEHLKKEIISYFSGGKTKNGESEGRKLFEKEGKQGNSRALTNEFLPPSEPFASFQLGKEESKSTLYLGGGTPSILSIEELEEIIHSFPFFEPNQIEFTIEANPEDVTEEKVLGWKNLGINRVSLGVQSLNQSVLDVIKRANSSQIIQALQILNENFENINIDLILGLPYSKDNDTLSAIKKLHKEYKNITHTSIYILEEEHYPKEWKDHYPTEEEVQSEYSRICEYLDGLGWNHYEISNWARPGNESKHNQSYWNHSNYRGFGLSAASYENERRFSNANSFSGYFEGKYTEEYLNNEQIELEKMMFGLRTFGLDESLIANRRKIEPFLKDGFLQKEGKKIFPTKTGIFMLDYIISELI